MQYLNKLEILDAVHEDLCASLACYDEPKTKDIIEFCYHSIEREIDKLPLYRLEAILETELKARFESAAEEWNDELDFYMDLLETGITVEMVRKYMDDETANHMQKYCEEHGLL